MSCFTPVDKGFVILDRALLRHNLDMKDNHEKDTTGDILSELESLRFDLVFYLFGIILVFCILDEYFFIESVKHYTHLLADFLLNVGATALVFLLSAKFYSRFANERLRKAISSAVADGQDRFLETVRNTIQPSNAMLPLGEVGYQDYLKEASRFDMVVQGWIGFPKRYHAALSGFFDRGGKSIIITYDEGQEDHLFDMATRMDMSPNEARLEIVKTRERFLECAGKFHANQISFRKSKQKLTYCMMRFQFGYDEVNFVISFYADHSTSVSSVPAIIINRRTSRKAFGFFEEEWNRILDDKKSVLVT